MKIKNIILIVSKYQQDQHLRSPQSQVRKKQNSYNQVPHLELRIELELTLHLKVDNLCWWNIIKKYQRKNCQNILKILNRK